MAAPRFFVDPPLAPAPVGDTIELPEACAHHAIRVARLGVGDALTLFDGAGGEYAATIVRVDRRGAAVRLERHDAIEREPALAVTLAQALAASGAMEYAIRKATELGVAEIQPLATARSAPVPGGARGDKRLAHWRQIAIAACEQCGRNRVPAVHAAQSLAAWLAGWKGEGAVLDPQGEASLPAITAPAARFALLIGPEGGLAAEEIERARSVGFAAVRLGPRILRTETAGVAALAAIHALWGDFR